METGRWQLRGNWLERHQPPIELKGKVLVAWSQDNWFTMVTKLIFSQTDGVTLESTIRPEVSLVYKGRLNSVQDRYTFVLQHSMLGSVEGEGWIAPDTIVQTYWAIGGTQAPNPTLANLNHKCTGFESWYRLNESTYCLSSSIMMGHRLFGTMEAVLEKL
jgi:hypothetical protein